MTFSIRQHYISTGKGFINCLLVFHIVYLVFAYKAADFYHLVFSLLYKNLVFELFLEAPEEGPERLKKSAQGTN